MSLLDYVAGAQRKLLNPSGGCHSCPRKKIDFVPPTLKQTPVIWLGEAPGSEEAKNKEGFVGKSGQLLSRFAREHAGIPLESKSNVLHCRPPENATPKPKELSCCLAQFVLDEIRGYPIVVMCGSTPLSALFPGATQSHYRGNVAWHPDYPGQRFYSIPHPAYILRRPDLEDEYKLLMQRLGRIVRGEGPPKWRTLRGGTPAFFGALDAALAGPLVSLDLETTALESWNPNEHIRSLALTANGTEALFAHEHEPHWTAVLQRVQRYLEQEGKGVVGANVAFDVDWLEHQLDFSSAATGIHDVALMYHEARQYKMVSLKELVSRELDGYRYLVYDPSTETDLDLLSNYNAEDVIYPLALFRKGMKILGPKTRDLVTRVLGPASLIFRQITSGGIYMRESYRQKQIEIHKDLRRQAIEAWREADPQFIPTVHESGNGLMEYLFEIHKLPILARTEKEEASTDKSVIKQYVNQGAKQLEHLLTMREIDKLLSTYLEGFGKHLDKDGRIHSSYTLGWTDTGRPSSRDPNMQNIARDKDIRNLFGVPPGWKMLEGDLSQIEFRIMACRAKEENAIRGYLAGLDAHTITARKFVEDAVEREGGVMREPTKDERTSAKPVNFGLLYGGDWEVVQRQARNDYNLDWPQDKCERFARIFFETYPAFPLFHRRSRDRLIYNRGWFESVLGHVWHYNEWNSPERGKQDHAFRSALNSEAQGPAAEICFAIMIHTRRLLDKAKMRDVRFVNSVYDSILTAVPPHVDPVSVIEIMEEARALAHAWIKPWFIVPLVMDYKLGEAWGSLEDYKLAP